VSSYFPSFFREFIHSLLSRSSSKPLPTRFDLTLTFSSSSASSARRPRDNLSSTPSSKSDVGFSLVGLVGVPPNHPSALASIVLSVDSNSGIAEDLSSSCPWPVSEAVSTREPVFVADCRSLTAGFESRSWGETESALVIPRESFRSFQSSFPSSTCSS